MAFGAILKTGTEVLNRAGAILLIPIFTRLMTPSEYGVVNLITTFSAVFALLSLGFPVAQQVNYHRLKDSPQVLGSYLYTINVTSGIAMALAGVILLMLPWSEVIVRFILGTNEIRLFPHVALGVGIGCCAAFSNLSTGFLNIRRQFHIQSLLSLAGFAITAGVSWALLVNTAWGATARLLGMLLGGSIPLVFTMHLYIKSYHLKFDHNALSDAWRIGWPAALNWGIFLIINQSDRIILSHYLSLETVGFYTLAFTIASGIAVVVQSVAQSYSPLFMEVATRNNGHVRELETTSWASVQVVLIIGLLGSAWLPDLVRILLPPSYVKTITFIPCLVGALGLYIIFTMLSLNYNFHKKTLYMPGFTIFAASFSATLNLILIPQWGEHVAAINSLITYVALTAIALFVSSRVFDHIQFNITKTLWTSIAYSALVLMNHFTLGSFTAHMISAITTTLIVARLLPSIIHKLRSPRIAPP